jgi:DNA-binding response OmpR family regulator
MSQTILIVDDNVDVVIIVQTILEANGYEVRVAYDGAEALAQLAEHKPDLMMLDIMMPEMSGLEVLEQMREIPSSAQIPVILLTAKGDDEDVLSGYRFGANYYLPKPFTSEQLLYGIRLVLEQTT